MRTDSVFDDADLDRVAAKLRAIRVVTRDAPAASGDALVRFYGELLELAVPPEKPRRNGDPVVRFLSDRLELLFRLGREPTHPTEPIRLVVRSLSLVSRRFDEHRIEYAWRHGFSMTDQQILVEDPAHNRVELSQTWQF